MTTLKPKAIVAVAAMLMFSTAAAQTARTEHTFALDDPDSVIALTADHLEVRRPGLPIQKSGDFRNEKDNYRLSRLLLVCIVGWRSRTTIGPARFNV